MSHCVARLWLIYTLSINIHFCDVIPVFYNYTQDLNWITDQCKLKKMKDSVNGLILK